MRKRTAALVTAAAVLAVAGCAAPAGSTVPGPTVTATVPGPDVTVTVTTLAPAPPPGGTIAVYRGSGNQVTPAFNVPASGDYIVAWSFSGNADPALGGPTNFIITENGSGQALGLPNTVQQSGSGSTEVTGAGSTDSLNVQGTGTWTITVKSAS